MADFSQAQTGGPSGSSVTPQQAVQETISRFESWFDEEKSSQGGY